MTTIFSRPQCVDYGLFIFLILAQFWLRETGQICGFWAFPRECIEGMNRLKFHMLMYPDHLHNWLDFHYTDATMDTIASQIISLMIVYSTVYSDAHQRWYQSSASLAFVRGIHLKPVNSPHKWPVTGNVSIWWRHHVVMLWWFSLLWCPFDLVKLTIFGVSGHYLENTWE